MITICCQNLEIDKENREHGEDKTNQTGVNNVVDNEQSETQRAARGNLDESSDKNNNSTGDDSNDILQKMVIILLSLLKPLPVYIRF